MTANDSLIAENLGRVREKIAAAAKRSGRTADDITLVAVTKYVGVEEIQALQAAGCSHFGESRPQQLWQKAAALDPSIQWHMIGHLQRNKVRKTLPLVSLLHSCDSRRLLDTLNQTAGELQLQVPILLEVNISGESAKHGLEPGQVQGLLATAKDYPHLEIRGLMAMAGLEGGTGAAEADFEKLRKLRDQLQKNCPACASLHELSMGMSRDFEAAIEQGATIVRVGSSLFEGIDR